jgi:hypothetical protein
MKIVEFPEQNVIYAKDQPQYWPLPAFKLPNDARGQVICCWKLTWIERIKIAFTGKIWHSMLTFNKPLQPQMMWVDKPKGMKG